MNDLSARVNWSSRTKTQKGKDTGFVKKISRAKDAMDLAKQDPKIRAEVKTLIRPGESNKQTRNKQKIQTFIDSVKGGLSPEDAAAKIGLELGEVANIVDSRDMKKVVADMVNTGSLTTEMRQAMVRGGLNTMLAETYLQRDRKGFTDVAKLMMQDPQMGMSGPANAVGVQVNVSVLKDLADKLKDDETDGLNDKPLDISPL